MNYQLTQIEKNNIQSCFSSSNYIDLERHTSSVIKKGCNDIFVYTLQAIACAKQRKFLIAEYWFLKVIKKEPNNIDHLYNLSEMYREKKDFLKSYEILKKILKIKPNNIKTLLSFSLVSHFLKNFENSFKAVEKVLKIDPKNTDAMLQMSLNFMDTGLFVEALNLLFQINEINGSKPEINADISMCYFYLGEIEKAKKFNSLAGGSLNALYNNSLINLKLGNLKKGWQLYEAGLNKNRKLNIGQDLFSHLPYWTPSKKYNSVLVIGEQGIGDEIMFSSLIIDLKKYVDNIFLLCDERLKFLFIKKYKFIKFIDDKEPEELKRIESKIAIGSLGKYFRNHELDFKKNTVKCNFIKNRIDKFKKKKLIGISWKTKNKQFSKERNVELIKFLPIFKNKNFDFISLQYYEDKNEISNCENTLNKKIFIDHENDNFSNIQGLTENILKCDYVITIDNSITHLSGFLNVKTFLMLPLVSEWRWFQNRSDTLWYDSVKIFRQTKKSDWNSVINKLIVELNKEDNTNKI